MSRTKKYNVVSGAKSMFTIDAPGDARAALEYQKRFGQMQNGDRLLCDDGRQIAHGTTTGDVWDVDEHGVEYNPADSYKDRLDTELKCRYARKKRSVLFAKSELRLLDALHGSNRSEKLRNAALHFSMTRGRLNWATDHPRTKEVGASLDNVVEARKCLIKFSFNLLEEEMIDFAPGKTFSERVRFAVHRSFVATNR